MSDYQLLVIGAGPGGYTAALRAAELGLRTAIVDFRETGGTCLNRGCVPTKTLLHASEIFHEAQNGSASGIHADGISINMEELFAHKDQITAQLSAGIDTRLKSAGIDQFRGSANITAPNTVQIALNDGETTQVTCDNILIATGSSPIYLPLPGFDLPGVMTSDEILNGSDHLYRSIVIIGGGVIGIEFATFYRELGTQVTIVEGLDRILPGMDKEISQSMTQIMKRQGVEIHTSSTVQSIDQGEQGLEVHYLDKDKQPCTVTGEAVLCSVGRRPYCAGLFADGLQPEFVGRSLKVDERFQTSIPGIYAIGDVSSKIQLAHVAAAQGAYCVELLAGIEPTADLSIVPSCVYCHPEIACVGLTEAEAKAAEIPYKTGKAVLGGNARTVIADTGRAFIKLIANAENRTILGAQIVCEHSTDMISQISEAMANHLTADQLLAAMRPHPTYEEALADALKELCRKLG